MKNYPTNKTMRSESVQNVINYKPMTSIIDSNIETNLINYLDIATETGYQSAMLNLAVDLEFWFDLNDDYFYDQIDLAINALSTKRGYTSTCTSAVVNTQINSLIEAYTAFLCLFRLENSKQALNYRNQDISELYKVLPQEGYGFNDIDAFSTDQPTDQDVSTAINNSVWMQSYVGKLMNVPLPKKIAELLESIFGYVHLIETDAPVNTEVQFWSTLTAQYANCEKPSVVFNAAMSDIETAFNTYPDLRTVLSLLDFSSDNTFGKEWKRDLLGNSVPCSNDPMMKMLLTNAFYAVSGDFTSLNVASTTPRKNVVFMSQLTSKEAEERNVTKVNYAELAYAILFAQNIYLVSLNTKKIGLGCKHWKVVLPGTLDFGTYDMNTTGLTIVKAMTVLMDLFSKSFGDLFPLSLVYTATAIDGSGWDLDDNITEFFGQKAFNLPSTDQDFIKAALISELILGAEHRTALITKIRELDTYSVSK